MRSASGSTAESAGIGEHVAHRPGQQLRPLEQRAGEVERALRVDRAMRQQGHARARRPSRGAPIRALHQRGEEARLLMHRHAEMQAQRILRVEVEGQDLLAPCGEHGGNARGEGCLADTPLGRDEGDERHGCSET
jgi:hypothetical protein